MIIPGMGSLICAGLELIHGVITAIKDGNWEALGNAALSALTKAIPFVGPAIGKALEIGIKVTVAVVKATKEIIAAVQSGDPMKAVFGILEGVASGVASAGGAALKGAGALAKGAGDAASKSIEQLSKGFDQVMGYVQKGVKLAHGAAQSIQSAAKGNWDGFVSGLAGVVGGLGDMGLGDGVKKVTDNLSKGVQTVNHLVHGRYGAALQGATQIAGQLGASAPASHIKKTVEQGKQLQQKVTSGDLEKSLASVLQTAQGFAKDPAVQQLLGLAKPVMSLIQGAKDGSLQKTLSQFGDGIAQFFNNPTFGKVAGFLGQVAQTIGQSAQSPNGKSPTTQDILTQILQSKPLQQLFQAAQSGDIQKGAQQIATPPNALHNNALQQGLQALQTIAEIAQGLAQGSFGKALGALQQSPIAKDPAFTVLSQIATLAESFVKAFASGDIGQSLAKLNNANSQTTANSQAKQDDLARLTQTLQPFQILQLLSGTNIQQILQQAQTAAKTTQQTQQQFTQAAQQLQQQLQQLHKLAA
jgi:hypothetical protein